jgi:hypothetical protein
MTPMELNQAFDSTLAILAKVRRDQLDAAAAFAAEGALERTVQLPFGESSGAVLMAMAATDQFTHGWDLARAIGLPADLDPGLAADLLGQYIAAFENADADGLERLLLADATLEATPLRTWFRGRETCVPFLRRHVLGVPGDWRMLPASANGQPAAVCFVRGGDGAYQPYGVCVLTIRDGGISQVVSFGGSGAGRRLRVRRVRARRLTAA